MSEARQIDESPTTTKYHAGFVSGLRLLMWRYREQIVTVQSHAEFE